MKINASFLKTNMRTLEFALLSVILLAGCSFAPRYAKPVVPTPDLFKEAPPEQIQDTGNWKPAEPKDGIARSNWWEIFHDSALNALEDQVAGSNQSVAAALANFLAARAVVKQAQSQYYPTLTTAPSITKSRQFYASTQPGTPGKPYVSSEYSLPMDASWEPDLWGSVRNTVKANSSEAQATLADLGNVRLTVQAEVAADYFQLRVLDAEKVLLDGEVIAYQESLKLTQVELDANIVSGQDVAQAETQLDITRAQATDLGVERAVLEHAIATLLGKPASLFSITANTLAIGPAEIPLSVPSQMLERRPDVAGAERRVAEANSQIGVARAAYFPTLTLGGSAGLEALGNLGSTPTLVWSVGAGLAETLFDGGKRKAVTEQARAIYQGTVANYRETVLGAFQDVEDNLSTLRILSLELQQQDAAVAASQNYLVLADVRYKSGLDGYLDVITAQTTLLSNQRTGMNLRMEQMTASVQLIKALGGGWNATNQPAPANP